MQRTGHMPQIFWNAQKKITLRLVYFSSRNIKPASFKLTPTKTSKQVFQTGPKNSMNTLTWCSA